MSKIFVRVLCDVYCEWHKHHPWYRVYVGDDMFTERTWIWTNEYLEEALQIEADPGKYLIRFDLLTSGKYAALKAKNFRVEHGPAIVTQDGVLEIIDAN